MFYELYCEGCDFNFRFTHDAREVAVITLHDPLCRAQQVTLHKGAAYDEPNDDMRRAIEVLAADTLRLTREAMTMQREYMQGASGLLDCDAKWGQMLFCADFDSVDDIGNY